MARLRPSVCPVVDAHLQTAAFLPPAVERLYGDPGFFADLWSGSFVRHAQVNLPQRRHDLPWFVPLDGPDPLFLQVGFLSHSLVQISPVTSVARSGTPTRCLLPSLPYY